jgi:hypothetical protein
LSFGLSGNVNNTANIVNNSLIVQILITQIIFAGSIVQFSNASAGALEINPVKTMAFLIPIIDIISKL